MKALSRFLFVLIIPLFVLSCSDSSTDEGMASITVRLMDDPGDFEHVYIEVVDVLIKMGEDEESEEWESLAPINGGVYDLLELTGGLNALLVDDFQVPAGLLNEMRLVLGANNSIVINGDSLPLNTPSAQQSGLKLKMEEVLEPNISYTFLLDFVVDESIVIAGNSGNINLKPVIRASVEANAGAISGSVDPFDFQVEVVADNGVEQVSTYTDDLGNFLLVGLDEGFYTLTVTPEETSGFTAVTVEDVEVIIGQTTVLDPIVFE